MRRRAFAGCVIVCLCLTLVPAIAWAQKLVILVRHAERADGGAPSSGSMSGQDPLLSAAGQARAEKLTSVLGDAGIRAVFATEYRRTQDTAKPLAAKLGLTVQSMKANDIAGLIARLKAQHAHDVVLLIGHSNTLPEIIKQFGGPAVTIPDSEYDNLFILVPATGAMTRIRY